MQTSPAIFNFEQSEVRIIVQPDGEALFVAADVCGVLQLANVGQALGRLDEDEKGDIILNDVTGRPQAMKYLTEPGLYALVLSSRKPEAKAFQRWVRHEVLPQLRKTGTYALGPAMPKTLPEALRAYALELEQGDMLRAQLAEAQPAVEFFTQVADSKDAIPIADAARVLNVAGVGQNKLFAFLREQRILQSNQANWNMPYQEYITRGYFRVVEQKWQDGKGDTRISTKTLVLQKGLDYIRKALSAFS
jgi:prophage antirepressor-like protein